MTRASASQRAFVDPAGALEPVEQPRDPGGGEQHRPGEVDPPQPALGREVELHEHVVVAQRQPVLRLEARRRARA